jgi:hypothetical protein
MLTSAPTRITIEVHPPTAPGAAPVVQVSPTPALDHAPRAAEPREEIASPAAYEPADCTCLDGPCDRDHANE